MPWASLNGAELGTTVASNEPPENTFLGDGVTHPRKWPPFLGTCDAITRTRKWPLFLGVSDAINLTKNVFLWADDGTTRPLKMQF